MHAPGRLPAALALALLVLLSGCTGSTSLDEQQARDSADRIVDVVRRAVEQAKERNRRDAGDTPASAPPDGQVLETQTRTDFDYAAYQRTLSLTLSTLDEFWSQQLPMLGGTYSPPQGGFKYYRPEEAPGPPCGSEPAPPRNAFYCPVGDFIAWDESGLMIPFYVAGDFAAAFVLAHEYGHAMQARLSRQEPLGVLRELQADCFAGAWARYVQDRRLLDEGDLDEATLAVFQGRDVPGTEFTDPRAHGSGFERTRAFSDGYEDGVGACYPAPSEDWLIGRTAPR